LKNSANLDTVGAGVDRRRFAYMQRLDRLGLKALDVIEACMSQTENPSLAYAAARDVLDRRWGKARTEATVTVQTADLGQQHLEALKALAAKQINVLPNAPATVTVDAER
jgi:hypothetical protein